MSQFPYPPYDAEKVERVRKLQQPYTYGQWRATWANMPRWQKDAVSRRRTESWDPNLCCKCQQQQPVIWMQVGPIRFYLCHVCEAEEMEKKNET